MSKEGGPTFSFAIGLFDDFLKKSQCIPKCKQDHLFLYF